MKFPLMLMAVWMAVLSAAPAEPSVEPAATNALRQYYQTLLTEAEGHAMARWLAALEGQERQRLAEGDFDGAARIRERRLELLAVKTAAATQRPPVLLSPASARTSKEVDFQDEKKVVARFRRTGSMMEWELPAQTPGTYQVVLVFGVLGDEDKNERNDPYKDPKVPLPERTGNGGVFDFLLGGPRGGGVVEFRKLSNFKDGGTVLRCSVRPSGGWATERSVAMGRVELEGKSMKFSLRAVDAQPAGVMDFYRLELVPAAPAAVPADPAGLKELARLKEVYQKQFTEQTRGVTAKYIKNLGDLEISAARSSDTETLALVRQEKQRMSQPESRTTGSAPPDNKVRVLPVTERLYMLAGGEARLTNQGDYLTKIRPANDCIITWKLAGLGVPSGTYSVEAECRLTPEHGGTAVLTAAANGGVTGPPMPCKFEPPQFNPYSIITRRRPDGTPGTSTLRTFTLGKVTIPKGSDYLKLQVTSLKVPDGSLCDLKLLRLTPVPAASP